MFADAIESVGIDIDQFAIEAQADNESHQFTFFAPGNEALLGMSPSIRENLLEDKDALEQLIRHSMITQAVLSTDFGNNVNAVTLDAGIVELHAVEDQQEVTDLTDGHSATILQRDIRVDGGVVQIIDGVLMPPTSTEPTVTPTPEPVQAPAGQLSEVIGSRTDLSMFADAIDSVGIDIDRFAIEAQSDNESHQFTFFAPGNEAFNAMDPTVRASLLGDKDALERLIRHSMITQAVPSTEFWRDSEAVTLDSGIVELHGVGAQLEVKDLTNGATASILQHDIPVDGGLVQIMDGALMPSTE